MDLVDCLVLSVGVRVRVWIFCLGLDVVLCIEWIQPLELEQ